MTPSPASKPSPGIMSTSHQRELQELRSTVRNLEIKLKAANKAEKPLETESDHQVGDKVGPTFSDLFHFLRMLMTSNRVA